MENIQENNRLIGEFMGIKPIEINPKSFCWNDQPFFSCLHDTPEEVMESFSKYAKYHESWNWLMPVVRKIVTISCNEDNNAFLSDEYTSILETVPLAIIEDAYKVVVEFIKWYNLKEKHYGLK